MEYSNHTDTKARSDIKEKQNNSNDDSGNQQDYTERVFNIQAILKSSSKEVVCPFCKKEGKTRIEEKCSFSALFFCTFGLFVVPSIVQLIRGKDLNCSDVDHFCINCENKLTSYKSCC